MATCCARRATGRCPTTSSSRTTARPSGWSGSTARRAGPAEAGVSGTTIRRRSRRIRSAGSRADGMDALGMTRYRTPLAVITEDHAPSGRTAARADARRSSTATATRSASSRTPGSRCCRPIAGPHRISSCGPTASSRTSRVERQPSRACTTAIRAARRAHGRRQESSWWRARRSSRVRLLMLSALSDRRFRPRASTRTICSAATSSPTASAARSPRACRGRFDKSLTLDSDWATDSLRAPTEFLRANGLWAGGAIYNNTSDQALPLALGAHARQPGPRHDLGGVHQRSGADRRGLADFLDHEVRPAAVGELHGEPGAAQDEPDRAASTRDATSGAAGRRYIVKDWHSHDCT